MVLCDRFKKDQPAHVLALLIPLSSSPPAESLPKNVHYTAIYDGDGGATGAAPPDVRAALHAGKTVDVDVRAARLGSEDAWDSLEDWLEQATAEVTSGHIVLCESDFSGMMALALADI